MPAPANLNEIRILAESQLKNVEVYISAGPYSQTCRTRTHPDDRSARSAVCRIDAMSQAAPAITRSPAEVVRVTPVSQAPNGICYAMAGEVAGNSVVFV